MSRQLRLEHPGAIWHVTSRGNEKRSIFHDDRDRECFVERLGEVVRLRRWVLHAWVLMGNHYHLIVETPEVPSLSLGVKRLNEGYAGWFNARHDRVGHLFQGRFKGILVEREVHLLELIRYVVLNPVRSGMVVYAGDWVWSNYRATAGLISPEPWLEIEWTLSQFDPFDRASAHERYRLFVADGRGAAYKPSELLMAQIYLGGEGFRARMQELVEAKPRSREHPHPQTALARAEFGVIASAVAEEFSIDEQVLRTKSRSDGRKALATLAWTDGGMTHAAIAAWMGVTLQAVSKMISAAAARERESREFSERMIRLRRRLS